MAAKSLTAIVKNPAEAPPSLLTPRQIQSFLRRLGTDKERQLQTLARMAETMLANQVKQRAILEGRRTKLERKLTQIRLGLRETGRNERRITRLINGQAAKPPEAEVKPAGKASRKPPVKKKVTKRKIKKRPPKIPRTRKATGAGPRTGSKNESLFNEIVRHGSKGIASSELVDFAVTDETINPKHEERSVVATRVFAMIQSLREAELIENVGETHKAVWRSTTTAEAKAPKPDEQADGRNVRPPKQSNLGAPPAQKPTELRELRQSFLNALLCGKKKGLILDRIVKAVKESDHSGFMTADKDDDEIRIEVGQFLRMNRPNYACDAKLPEHWWVKEEAPYPFAKDRK